MSVTGKAPISAPLRHNAYRVVAWVFVVAIIAFYARQIVRVGIDLRQDYWVYWTPNHFLANIDEALNHGNTVLQEAQQIAQDEQSQKTPEQIAAEQAQAAAGHPVATILNPGPGLFESPLSVKIFRERWHHLKPIYGLILRGWVQTYDHLLRDVGEGGDFKMDYPPLRLLVMSLWAWNVQTNFPHIDTFPREPQRVFDPSRHQTIVITTDLLQPMLRANTTCEGISAIAIFILVWLWMERRRSEQLAIACNPAGVVARNDRAGKDRWGKDCWGDPMLLAPFVLFAVCTYFHSNVTWHMPLPDDYESSLIDVRVLSIGWWIFLLLRFIAAVCLARFLPRPFRAPMCALVAGTLAWINPASIFDSFGWPQWDTWLPPFFLLAAICVTLNFWVTAGFLLGLGCMFKGQLLFVAPVLILCPLFAGWPGRFLKLIAGLATGSGLVVWPWLVTNTNAIRWIFLVVAIATFFCALSSSRRFLGQQFRHLWRELSAGWPKILRYTTLCSAIGLAVSVACLILVLAIHRGTPTPAALLAAAIFIVPWLIPRRLLGGWILMTFAASLWFAGFYLGGSKSWWKVGFLYGTQRHQNMEVNAHSLSNLASILHEYYGWELHDVIVNFNRPIFGAQNLDVQTFCGLIFYLTVLLCAIAAGIHIRRRDPKFLVVLAAPWMLFAMLLTQMAPRYTILPAVVSSALIGFSAEMSLLAFLQTVLACTMLGNQMLQLDHGLAPITYSITQPTYPELSWLTVALAAIYLCCALIPSRNWRRRVEVL